MCEAKSFYCFQNDQSTSECKISRCGRMEVKELDDSKMIKRNVCSIHERLMIDYKIEDFFNGQDEILERHDNYKQITDNISTYYDDFLNKLNTLKTDLETVFTFLESEESKMRKIYHELQDEILLLQNQFNVKKEHLATLRKKQQTNENNQPRIDQLTTEIDTLNSEITRLESSKRLQEEVLNKLNSQITSCNQNIHALQQEQVKALNRGMTTLREIDQKYGENPSQLQNFPDV